MHRIRLKTVSKSPQYKPVLPAAEQKAVGYSLQEEYLALALEDMLEDTLVLVIASPDTQDEDFETHVPQVLEAMLMDGP